MFRKGRGLGSTDGFPSGVGSGVWVVPTPLLIEPCRLLSLPGSGPLGVPGSHPRVAGQRGSPDGLSESGGWRREGRCSHSCEGRGVGGTQARWCVRERTHGQRGTCPGSFWANGSVQVLLRVRQGVDWQHWVASQEDYHAWQEGVCSPESEGGLRVRVTVVDRTAEEGSWPTASTPRAFLDKNHFGGSRALGRV